MNGRRYLQTIVLLRPSQVVHRVRLRSQKAVLAWVPPLLTRRRRRPTVDRCGWPDNFAPIERCVGDAWPSAEDNAAQRFLFLNEIRDLGSPPDWTQAAASQLWRYHLHYFEWAWAFATHPDREWARGRFSALWDTWRASSRVGQGDAWSPFVVSLRAWGFCGVYADLMEASPMADDFCAELRLHAAYLRFHVEHDVGGNHLIKNLKALIGMGVFFGDERMLRRASGQLEQQLAVQVLVDGGHYERSPSYHCQVLGDLLDVHGLLAAARAQPVPGLEPAIDAMRSWLGALLSPDGDVPLLNDCTLVGRRRISFLAPPSPSSPERVRRLVVLQPSGYVVARPDARLHLVADIGAPCPPDLPAHAHADCLSFELAVDGRRIIVDTGTSTYVPGERRQYERSTAAHNTIEIDGQNQTDVWGTFRAGRRAHPQLEHVAADGDAIEFTASHDGYERLRGRPRHRRTWRLVPGRLDVVDHVCGAGRHRTVLRFHFAPGTEITRRDDGAVVAGPLVMTVAGPAVAIRIEPTQVSTGFGVLEQGTAIVVTTSARLPIVIRTSFFCDSSSPT